jgi:hypothetical protein
MPRLLLCPSCGRHVRATERECPFCGRVDVTVTAPARLSVALLGLSLVACSSGEVAKPDGTPSKSETPKPEVQEPEVQPEPEVDPEPEPKELIDPEPPDAIDNVGTNDGTVADPLPNQVPPTTKYGGPRPAKKYGGPPSPDGPLGDF